MGEPCDASHHNYREYQSAAHEQPRRCGAVPFVTSMIQGRLYAVVNANTFEVVDRGLFRSAVTSFDGETPENRLERRRRTWIPNVTIANKGA